MRASLFINGSHDPIRTNFVSWSPSTCDVRLDDPSGATGPVTVELSNIAPGVGGQVEFRQTRISAPQDSFRIDLPLNGNPVRLYVSGKFPHASVSNEDAGIMVRSVTGGAVLASTRLMVRVRKDANLLTVGERDRFLNALAQLNARGLGRFAEFRAMHNADVEEEAHRRPGFLPWHRAYLLDLERELQVFDPSVALPYWRFDRPAPNLFTQDFIGLSNATGSVRFSSGNPLQFWRTDNGDGITRRPLFNTATEAAFTPFWGGARIHNEAFTLNRGAGVYRIFWELEGNPHGYAHTCFSGYIDSPETAPKDPLFFLLHMNVDRLWAKWQWVYQRFDVTQGQETYLDGNRIGHRRGDTMWPWNGSSTPPRPQVTAPGGGLADSPIVTAPGAVPKVEDMVDFQGLVNESAWLGFDYDDVPFTSATPVTPLG